MASGWDVYYVVFLSAVLSLVIPIALSAFSKIFSKGHAARKVPGPSMPKKSLDHADLGERVNVRYFMAANAAMVLIALVLILLPCISTIQSGDHPALIRGILAVVSIAGFAALGLLYSVRKGDLGWLESYQKRGDRR
ncbi:MAG: hypothetical protein ACXWPM_02450 [Bdellovibrionota bacterium]